MKLKTIFMACTLHALLCTPATAKGTPSTAEQIEDARRKFFMPLATNSLCPAEYRVGDEKLEAQRRSVLTYLDYLQAVGPQTATAQFTQVRAEISSGAIAPAFLAEATKIFKSYPPAESRSLFCARLTRMIDTSIDMMGILVVEDRKRRGIADPK